jgi:hypothetical protein
VEPFAVNVRAATTQRRSTETQRLRQVTQADMPLSYLPYPDATQEQHPPNMESAPSVQQDELESYTPRQFQSAGGDNSDDTRRGRNMVDQDLLDATNLNHHSNKESDNEEMPKSFGYLSEGDPNFQGALEFVMEKQLSRSSSVLRNGSKKEKASDDHEGSGEQSGTPQEGRPLESSDDESTREILNTLSSGDNISPTNNTQPPAEDIPGASLTRENVSTGTRRMRTDDLPKEGEIIGEKHQDGESKLSGQQSTFDKSMPGTTFETVVCRDQMIEPVLYSNAFGRVSHIRDLAPMEWSDQDRKKYHRPELQALLGGPMPADIQLVIKELGRKASDGWCGAVVRQVFRPIPRPGFHCAVFKRKRLLGRTSYPTFLDMGPSNNESLELQGLQMARISVANEDRHFENLLRKPGQVLLTPGQYRLLGARIVALLKEISELPLLPIHAKIEADPLCETTRLELEYGIALFQCMLEVARGFYDNTISLEGRTNKTAILLVEVWWWLHSLKWIML